MKNRSIGRLLSVLLVIAMMLSLCACGAKKEEEKETKEAKETTVFEGELVDAQNSRLVVRATEETMVFATTDATAYNLDGEATLCVGDDVEVEYHKEDGTYIADVVRVTKHNEKAPVFGGEVTELHDDYLTVQSESMTVVFTRDNETKVEGDLSQGDAVTVTYEGNLSEDPRAISIVVIREQDTKVEKSMHGTISEVADDSVLVSVDSAHACRIYTDKNTKISGKDTKVKVGDEVRVVYTGEINEHPTAKTIEILKNAKAAYHVLDGVIDKVAKDSLTVKTAKKNYTFKIVKETRIQNEKYMKPGHMTTITYAGDPAKDAVAASIYCAKDTLEDVQKKDSEKKAAPKKESKKKEATPEKKAEPEKKEEPEKKDEPEEKDDPADVGIRAEGEILEWPNDGDGKTTCKIKVEGGATLELDIKDAKVAAGWVPKEGDEVIIVYNKTKMTLLEIEVRYKSAARKAVAPAAADESATPDANTEDARAETEK